jgi:hypothetical protein
VVFSGTHHGKLLSLSFLAMESHETSDAGTKGEDEERDPGNAPTLYFGWKEGGGHKILSDTADDND